MNQRLVRVNAGMKLFEVAKHNTGSSHSIAAMNDVIPNRICVVTVARAPGCGWHAAAQPAELVPFVDNQRDFIIQHATYTNI